MSGLCFFVPVAPCWESIAFFLEKRCFPPRKTMLFCLTRNARTSTTRSSGILKSFSADTPCVSAMKDILPDGHAFGGGDEHRIFVGDAEGVIPGTDVRQGAVHTPFAQ